MLWSLILIDGLSSACWEKEKKTSSQGLFTPALDTPCWLCHVGVSWLLGAIKG
jgi:hypothetical protein